MWRKLCVAFLMLTATNALADDLRIYGFTSTFVECVKKHAAESNATSADGAAQSSLMNGQSVINGPNLDSQYWAYMDCLTPSNAGVDSELLKSSESCPELSINLGDRSLYVPPGVIGKSFSIGEKSWVCTNGGWERVSGGNSEETMDKYDGCAAIEKKEAMCSFQLPAKGHGGSFLANSSLADAVDGVFYAGKALFTCNNGSWESAKEPPSCEPVLCNEQQETFWSSSDSVSQCSGVIDDSGVATQKTLSPRYYSSLQEALLKTKSMMGIAEYACTASGWRLKYSTCTQKPAQSLSCTSRVTSIGTQEFTCQ